MRLEHSMSRGVSGHDEGCFGWRSEATRRPHLVSGRLPDASRVWKCEGGTGVWPRMGSRGLAQGCKTQKGGREPRTKAAQKATPRDTIEGRNSCETEGHAGHEQSAKGAPQRVVTISAFQRAWRVIMWVNESTVFGTINSQHFVAACSW